jgi:hypothetical protein
LQGEVRSEGRQSVVDVVVVVVVIGGVLDRRHAQLATVDERHLVGSELAVGR